MLDQLLDPAEVFWSAVENKPRSSFSGMLQKKLGVKSGFPDVIVIPASIRPVFIELKSRSGRPSRTQKEVRAGLIAVGCRWWMARSTAAALKALQLSGVPFRKPWTSPQCRPWKGPFTGDEKRFPTHPAVAARAREANRRWLERRKAQGLPVRVSRARYRSPEERRAQVREATRRWRERQRALKAAGERGASREPSHELTSPRTSLSDQPCLGRGARDHWLAHQHNMG
jgi:hypothetical protein